MAGHGAGDVIACAVGDLNLDVVACPSEPGSGGDRWRSVAVNRQLIADNAALAAEVACAYAQQPG
jgi:hypothetical protein